MCAQDSTKLKTNVQIPLIFHKFSTFSQLCKVYLNLNSGLEFGFGSKREEYLFYIEQMHYLKNGKANVAVSKATAQRFYSLKPR